MIKTSRNKWGDYHNALVNITSRTIIRGKHISVTGIHSCCISSLGLVSISKWNISKCMSTVRNRGYSRMKNKGDNHARQSSIRWRTCRVVAPFVRPAAAWHRRGPCACREAGDHPEAGIEDRPGDHP